MPITTHSNVNKMILRSEKNTSFGLFQTLGTAMENLTWKTLQQDAWVLKVVKDFGKVGPIAAGLKTP
eukprot:3184395-Amphidinium_carterae.2